MVKVQSEGSDNRPVHLSYVVIAPRCSEGWLFVRHRRRGGYELPAGHPEPGESSEDAAIRELAEETGARCIRLVPVTYYSVDAGNGKEYGRLFYAEVDAPGKITDTDEIESVTVAGSLPDDLTLPEVMTFLFGLADDFFRYSQR